MGHDGSGNPPPWEVSDAPALCIELLKKSIIGIEINIKCLEGKYKMSQELGDEDRQGVVDGVKITGTDLGLKIAHTEERGRLKKLNAAS